MSNTNTGGPAFPQAYQHTEVVAKMYETGELTAKQLKQASSQLAGMTLRQYAAIHLKVPDSGEEWLDDMIRESLWNEFAAHAPAAPSAWAGADPLKNHGSWRRAYADSMLKARGE